ncbi:MAG: CRISPR-associated protein Csx3 [Methanothrix sp.]|nr:CRISPR-associated protein Csx3 [Methanothrix sp.]
MNLFVIYSIAVSSSITHAKLLPPPSPAARRSSSRAERPLLRPCICCTALQQRPRAADPRQGAVVVAMHSPTWQVVDVILPAPGAIHV